MTPMLIADFDRLVEAPDALMQLRRLLLNLAIRGKLLAQDDGDEPAQDLLQRVAQRRLELLDGQTPRRGRRSAPVAAVDDEPFVLPKTWAWTTLGQIGLVSPRNELDDDAEAGFVPMTLIPVEYGRAATHEVRPWKEIKKGYTHFADGDLGLAKITPCYENGKSTVFRDLPGGMGAGTTELHIVRPLLVNAEYLLLVLKSSYFVGTGIPKMTGTAGQKRVPSDYFAGAPIPLPPLDEQQRIVDKIQELLVLCEELQTSTAHAAQLRSRLFEAVVSRALADDIVGPEDLDAGDGPSDAP